MAYTSVGTTGFPQKATGGFSAFPVTVSFWLYTPVTVPPIAVPICLSNNDGSERLVQFTLNTNRTIALSSYNYGTWVGPTSSNNVAVGWSHVVGVFGASNSRTVYIDGGASSSVASKSVATNAGDFIGVGARANSTAAILDGNVAEVGVWNAALSTTEIASLTKGFSPKYIRPESLAIYLPLVRDANDELGDPLTYSAGSFSDHPRIYP